MLEIRVDLQEEYNILCGARRTAALRRQAKEGQHCFVKQDIKRRDELEYLDRLWQTKVRAEKEKGLVLHAILALSQQDQDYYHEKKNIFKPSLMRTPPGMPVDVKYCKIVIALSFIAIHGKLISNSPIVLPRINSMDSSMTPDSPTVFVTAQLPRIP